MTRSASFMAGLSISVLSLASLNASPAGRVAPVSNTPAKNFFGDVGVRENGKLKGMWAGGSAQATQEAGGAPVIIMDVEQDTQAAAGKSWAPERSPDFPFGETVEISAHLEASITELMRDKARGPFIEIRIEGPLGKRHFLFLSPRGKSVGRYHQHLTGYQGDFEGTLEGRVYVPENATKVHIGLYNSWGKGKARWSDISLSPTDSPPSEEWAHVEDFSEETPPRPDFLAPYEDIIQSPLRESDKERQSILLFGQTPEDIRQKANLPEWQPLVKQLLADADRTLTDPMPERLEDLDVPAARREMRRILESILATWITGEEQYKENAIKRLMNYAERPMFLPTRHRFITYDLVMAESVFGMAVAYDWLYSDLTQEQRDTVREAIVERLLPYYLYESDLEVVKPNVDGPQNWTAVLAGSAIIAKLVFGDEHPIFEEAYQRALENSTVWREYQSDGGSDEGAGYWNYMLSYAWASYMELLDKTGDDDGFFTEPGRADTEAGWYPIVKKPYGPVIGFGDDWPDPRWTMVPLMMERTEGHRKYTPWMQKWLLNNPKILKRTSLYGHSTPNLFGLGFALLAAIDNQPREITEDTLPPLLSVYDQTGSVIAASAWPEPEYYVSAKAGSLNLHAHADLGSFQYAMNGEVLLEDPGPDSYRTAGYFNWQKRFSLYKARAESHNIFTIDGRGNALENPYDPDHEMMRAEIIDAGTTNGVSQWTIVLDECYEGLENIRARRHFYFVHETGELAVIDEINTQQPREIVEHFLSRESFEEISDHEFSIQGKEPQVRLVFHSTVDINNTQLEPYGPKGKKQDASLKRLRVALQPAGSSLFATFIIPGENANVQFDAGATGQSARWTFPISGKTLSFTGSQEEN